MQGNRRRTIKSEVFSLICHVLKVQKYVFIDIIVTFYCSPAKKHCCGPFLELASGDILFGWFIVTCMHVLWVLYATCMHVLGCWMPRACMCWGVECHVHACVGVFYATCMHVLGCWMPRASMFWVCSMPRACMCWECWMRTCMHVLGVFYATCTHVLGCWMPRASMFWVCSMPRACMCWGVACLRTWWMSSTRLDIYHMYPASFQCKAPFWNLTNVREWAKAPVLPLFFFKTSASFSKRSPSWWMDG